MAYIVGQTPTPLHLVTPSENPIWYTASGVHTGQPRTTGYIEITWTGVGQFFNINDYIGFLDNWGNFVKFESVSNLVSSLSGRRFTSSVSTTLEVCLESLAAAINNSVLGVNFFAEVIASAAPGGLTLRINFKWDGSAGSMLALSGAFPTPGGGSNYLVTTVPGTVEYEPEEFLRAPYTIAKVYTNNEEPFPSLDTKDNKEYIGEMVKAFIGEDIIYFDPSHLLKTIVETELPQMNNGFKQPHQLKRYWIEYGTGGWYGSYSGTIFDPVDQTDIRWVLNAAQPLEYHSDLTDYWENPLNECASGIRRVLTNSPNTNLCPTPVVYSKQPLLFNQRWWLSFICEIDAGTLEIYYEARYTIGTSITGTVPVINPITATPVLSEIGVMTIDVSPSYLGFMSLPDEIQDYKVYIMVNGVQYTETRRFKVLCNCLPSRTQVMFLNRLGGWDTYYFIGDNNTQDKRVAQEYEKTAPIQPNPFNRGTAQFNIDYRRGLSLSSGQLTSCEFIWLEELLASSDIYIINNKGEFESVVLTKFNRDFSSRDQLYTIDIDIEKSIPTNNVNNTGRSSTGLASPTIIF